MENMTTVSFPGLGIGDFSFSRVAFTLFGRPVYWYGVIIMVGIIVAFAHALWRSKREGVTQDDLLTWPYSLCCSAYWEPDYTMWPPPGGITIPSWM